MEHIIKLIMGADSPVMVVIFSVVLVYLFLKLIYDAVKWISDRLNGYYDVREDKEDKEENINNRINKLEEHDEKHYNKLNELGEELKKVISMLMKVQETQSQTIVDTYRSVIFRIYHDNMKQGYITQTELDRFISLVDQYKHAGGDGIIDEKVYPEILRLPIRPE